MIVIGQFSGTVSFGGVSLTSAGQTDAFLAKYAGVNGAHVWSERLGGTGYDYGRSVAVDDTGDAFVTGYFNGTVDFGGAPLSSTGVEDIFLARYAGFDGAHQWSRAFGGIGTDIGRGIAIAGSEIVLTGSFANAVDFGGGARASAGSYDVFLAKYDAAGGAHHWSQAFGGTSGDGANAVSVAGSGRVVVTGNFANVVDFGGGPATSNGGGSDIFVLEIGP